jgi:hypothetical protein
VTLVRYACKDLTWYLNYCNNSLIKYGYLYDNTHVHFSQGHHHKISIWSSFYHLSLTTMWYITPSADLPCVQIGTMRWFPGSNRYWLPPRGHFCVGLHICSNTLMYPSAHPAITLSLTCLQFGIPSIHSQLQQQTSEWRVASTTHWTRSLRDTTKSVYPT